ncbi:hypothetical protein D8X55_01385 [Malacoplasma penetrans]|uniref:Uncharacterized protein n=1 Tax=Malacoplasma penetrans (strain HF-2) TaxID=272633 RepID=Q8EUL3_MALP2|nr:hypothetical protein D8X55_01385 [Malacoplasma penetrans]BAC44699.1 hypothetical protein [Malacoplasma penetrans HF-2]
MFLLRAKKDENSSIKTFIKKIKSVRLVSWIYLVLVSLATFILFFTWIPLIVLQLKLYITYINYGIEITPFEYRLLITLLLIWFDDLVIFFLITNMIFGLILFFKIRWLKKFSPKYEKCYKLALMGIFFAPRLVSSILNLRINIKEDLKLLKEQDR